MHDNGPEFIAHDFQLSLSQAGIEPKKISSHTPTANSIIEVVHKTVGQVIRTLLQHQVPQNRAHAEMIIDSAFATAMHATRCVSNTALGGYSPGALVFNRDMFLDIPLIADILTLQNIRQAKIDLRLLRANAKRIPYEFKLHDKVYVHNAHTASDKLKPVWSGPFTIRQVHTNNTVTLQRPNGVIERITIRRLKPAKHP